MCGINFIIDKSKNLSPDPIRKMSMLTHHRGPDETKSTVITTSHCAYHVAANRLKITDQSSASAQPFHSSETKKILLFNGEIYNHYEIKNELLNKSISFSSHSDTEVLFQWLRKYGKNGIKRLEGMFAFIFIDYEKDEVIVSRDQFGIKPLYYFKDDSRIIISSEINAIFGTGLVEKVLNKSQVDHYLLYKYAKVPETFYENIFELAPGATIHFDKHTWKIDRFGSFDKSVNNSPPELNKIEGLIKSSLIKKLNAQVPIGILLSGGVDSTLLLALARSEGFTIPSFSIVNSKIDESFGTRDFVYAKKAASLYSSEHHEFKAEISLLNNFENFIASMDQPIGDSSYLMTSTICNYASESMKILISGAGADELFAGYNRHLAFYTYLKNKKIFDILLSLTRPIINSLPTGIPHPWRKQLRLIKKLSNCINRSEKQTFHNFLTFNALNISNDFVEDHGTHEHIFSWALKHDQNNYLVSDVLALSDKASMRHGIELRVPYLDENLTKYLLQFNPEVLIVHGRKWILKEILKNHGGKEFTSRPKEGFGLPISKWMFKKETKFLWDTFNTHNHLIFNFFDKKIFDHLVIQHKNRKDDHGQLLWSILVLGHWLDHNF